MSHPRLVTYPITDGFSLADNTMAIWGSKGYTYQMTPKLAESEDGIVIVSVQRVETLYQIVSRDSRRCAFQTEFAYVTCPSVGGSKRVSHDYNYHFLYHLANPHSATIVADPDTPSLMDVREETVGM